LLEFFDVVFLFVHEKIRHGFAQVLFGGFPNAKFFGQLLDLCCQSNKSPNSYKRRQVLGMIGANRTTSCDERNGIESFINHGLHCYCLSALKPWDLSKKEYAPKHDWKKLLSFFTTRLMSREISSCAKSELFGWGFPGFCCEVPPTRDRQHFKSIREMPLAAIVTNI